MVVVPDSNEVAELEVTGQGASLARHTLHQAPIAKEAVCVVVDQVETGLVESSRGVSLGDGKANGVGDTLAQGAGSNLNTGGVMSLGVARSYAVDVL
jgi:hypothetical protein